jgi:hypothetical protein
LFESATNTSDRSIDVVINETSKYDDDIVKNLPSINYLRDIITKKRNKNQNNIIREYQEIPKILQSTLRGEKFYNYDNKCYNENRVLLFMSEFCLQ